MERHNCIFCNIATGKASADIVFQDEICTIFKDVSPQAPQHLLIIPNRHISSLDDLTTEQKPMIGHLMARLSEYAHANGFHNQGYRVVTNCGSRAGQSVFHLHFHLLSGRNFTWPPG